MSKQNGILQQRWIYRWRYALFLAPLLALCFAVTTDAADPLNATERAWLSDKGPIVFVSQTNYPPFEFRDRRGTLEGMCIELVQWMAAELGFKATFRDMTFKEAQAAVLSGRADVLTSLFYSRERDKRFDFSELTWEVPALIFVRAERPDISGLRDLQGKRIAMQRGDYAAEFLASKGISYKTVPTATFAEAIDRMIAGEADAVIGDQQVVLYHLFSHNLTKKVKSVGQPLYFGSNRLAVRDGQTQLVGILNKGLALARKRGIFERITHKWLGTHYGPRSSWLQRHARQLVIALAAVASFAALLIIWGMRLKKLVVRRTRELFEAYGVTRPVSVQTIGKSRLKMWLWILVVLILLCGGADYVLRNHVILPSYQALEKQAAEKAVSTCVDAVKREMYYLEQTAGAWAMWDDTYRFVQDANPAYVPDLRWKTLKSSGIHLIYIFDRDGRIVWGTSYDPVKNKRISLDAFSKASFWKNHPLLQHQRFNSTITGLIITGHGPLLLTSRPIFTSSGEGPRQGTLVMGRFLTAETIRQLSDQVQVPFNVKYRRSANLNSRERLLFTTLSPGKPAIETVDDDTLKAYGLLADLDGKPALLIAATLGRAFFQRGRSMARLVSATILALIVILGTCLFVGSMFFLKEVFHHQAHIEALVAQRTAALRRSEAQYRLLAENISDIIWIVDLECVFTYVSPSVRAVLGYAAKERIGTNLRALVDQETFSRVKNLTAELLQQPPETAGTIFEADMFHKNGATVPMEVNIRLLFDDQGKPPSFLCVARDITERKRLEAQVRQRLIALTRPEIDIRDLTLTDIVDIDLLQTLQDGFAKAFNMPSIIYGPRGTPITRPSCFMSFCKLVRSTKEGAARCEAFENAMMRALRESHKPQIRHGCALHNMVTGTVPIVIQDRHLANWGIGQMVSRAHDLEEIRRYAAEIGVDEENLMAAAKTLVPVDDGAFKRAVDFLNILAGQVSLLAVQNVQQGRDIARRKQAETAQQRLLRAIENTKESIVITDLAGKIQYVNPAFEAVTGYTREEAMGQNPRILKSGEHGADFYKQMWGTLVRGASWHGRIINKRKDGTLFTEDATISPVIDAAGKTINYVAVKRDVTRTIELENEKARLEEQYHQAQKVESIGRLAGGVAHDLNNLLAPILGYSELLLDDVGFDDARRDKVNAIMQAGLRARDLVRQLLAFSRKQTLEFRTVDINRVVVGIEKLLRRTIREDVKLELLPSPDPLTVMADVGQIEQVLMNLAVNAADAMPEGGKLTIETAQMDLDEEYAAQHTGVKPGRYVLLAVSDTGVGMDDETRKNIFEPFFSTKGERGTGLGLATVYGIVKQHGGNIWVYSEPGKGATFKIYLPVCEAAYMEESTVKREMVDLTGKETILLAEDNDQVRELARTVLERQGYTVLTAANGKEALTMLSRHQGPVHLLLTDVVMPEVNGRDLFIGAAQRHPGLKVLYMSGYTDNVIAHRGVLDKNVAFIQKPFTINALATKVREVLDQRPGDTT